MIQDVRYAWRTLIKSPWVTLAVLLSLGLGIGANVTIFSWVRAMLLEPFAGVPDQTSRIRQGTTAHVWRTSVRLVRRWWAKAGHEAYGRFGILSRVESRLV
jgi:putative ABC transport system permease protein